MTRFLSWWFQPIPARGWVEYWFKPAPLFDLAMCRIIMVGTALALLLLNITTERLQDYATLESALYMPIPTLKILLTPFGFDTRPDLSMLIMVKYVAVLSGIMAMIGLLTNISLAVFVYAYLIIITHFYSYSDFHHNEAPLMLALGYLALSPAGRVLSVDRLLRGRGAGPGMLEELSAFARWPILLGQWTFALVYLSAVLEKLAPTPKIRSALVRKASLWPVQAALASAAHSGVSPSGNLSASSHASMATQFHWAARAMAHKREASPPSCRPEPP